ncbi:cytochrome P450 [Candidatus Mycobacterium wuenschmannii]|uniref:Cytochrome P450 n=1 Tax=Candidatus Mycobacterium wuenschmannii TaxID=3027808 RepID=A0ABY8VXG7_9MYCO|nr:cytochrome P450 [Candidatus Mycobacterium wuenschmannii]WIM88006.1 cytochrome P450 [Candidatus Mycobacterium wuenschmannii]
MTHQVAHQQNTRGDAAARGHRLTGPRAVAALADLGLSSIAAGVLARRRPAVRVLETAQADRRAVARMKKLRGEFGRGPVELVLPGRRILVILDPNDVGRVLDDSPAPFHPANLEKRKALQWFQPHGVLITQGPIRRQRRELNESALDFGDEIHHLAGDFSLVIAEEVDAIATEARRTGTLTSSRFMTGWWRLVRRVMLGPDARDDETITDELMHLRKAGNWSFLALPQYRRRSRFLEHLQGYAENPHPNTLAGALAQVPAGGAIDPVGQMPQWMFAFDAAGMALMRALALLSTHPDALWRAIEDSAAPHSPQTREFLRAAVLESVRLWPTTPTILRDTVEDTEWDSDGDRFTIAAGTGVMIVTPAFHRDDQLLPFAHRFVPEIWLDGTAHLYRQLAPFSAGPAECPGRNLVLFVTSTVIAQLLTQLRLTLQSTPHLSPDRPLPMTLNQLTLEWAAEPASGTRLTDNG